MESQSELIQALDQQLQNLANIRDSSAYGLNLEIVPLTFEGQEQENVLEQKFLIWTDRTSKIISLKFNPKEKTIFRNRCLNSVSVKVQISKCSAYLKEK